MRTWEKYKIPRHSDKHPQRRGTSSSQIVRTLGDIGFTMETPPPPPAGAGLVCVPVPQCSKKAPPSWSGTWDSRPSASTPCSHVPGGVEKGEPRLWEGAWATLHAATLLTSARPLPPAWPAGLGSPAPLQQLRQQGRLCWSRHRLQTSEELASRGFRGAGGLEGTEPHTPN